VKCEMCHATDNVTDGQHPDDIIGIVRLCRACWSDEYQAVAEMRQKDMKQARAEKRKQWVWRTACRLLGNPRQ